MRVQDDREVTQSRSGVPGAEVVDASFIPIVLAYSQDVVRSGLRLILEDIADFAVVGEAKEVEGVLLSARSSHPRVLILDLELPEPDRSVVSLISWMRSELPQTEIVLISLGRDTADFREAIAAGALACVSNSATVEELVVAVRAAASGQGYLSAEVLKALASGSDSGLDGLTPREVEVIDLIAKGYTHAEIADLLFLSIRTVESHRARIQEKLGRLTRSELVGYAHEHGITRS